MNCKSVKAYLFWKHIYYIANKDRRTNDHKNYFNKEVLFLFTVNHILFARTFIMSTCNNSARLAIREKIYSGQQTRRPIGENNLLEKFTLLFGHLLGCFFSQCV